jgi:hypothetical protein
VPAAPPPGSRRISLASSVASSCQSSIALSLPAPTAVEAFCGDKSLADAIGACGPKKRSWRSPPSGTPPLLADKPTRALDGEAEMAIDEPKRPTGTGSLALCHLTVMASL